MCSSDLTQPRRSQRRFSEVLRGNRPLAVGKLRPETPQSRRGGLPEAPAAAAQRLLHRAGNFRTGYFMEIPGGEVSCGSLRERTGYHKDIVRSDRRGFAVLVVAENHPAALLVKAERPVELPGKRQILRERVFIPARELAVGSEIGRASCRERV